MKAGLGANGTGSISADIRGDLQTATGDVSLTAGAQAGDINLQQTTLTAGADAILTAVAGRIDHGEGLLSATNLAVSAADGVTANVLIATIDAVVTGVGDIRIASGDDITLTRLEAADGEIWVDALGSITAVDVVTGGASDANDITLSTFAITGNAADLHVQRLSAGGNGDITLSVQGALLQTLIASGGSPIIADVLEVKVPGAVSLETQVGTVTVHTQSSGDVVITQSGSGRLRVDDTEVADGAFTLNHSAGAADLAQVALLANDDIYDVVVSAGGDIRVGLVSTGPHYTDISDVPAPSLGAEAGVTIHGDVSLTSGGKITELGNDAGADLIGDRLVLQAATGITRLEIAANELVSVTSTSGNVQLTELDGEGEKSVGLLVTLVEATAGSVTVQAHGLMTVANVVAGGVDSIVRLVSESGTLEILEPGTGQPEALQATGGYALVAGDELISYRFFEGPRLVEYRSGGTFSFALPTDITADTIALESGATLTVAGTLTARDRLELISDANVFIDGSEGGRLVAASGSIGHVLIVARGTEQVTATVYDEETNVNTTVTQDTGYIDIETTALPAAQLELRALRDVFVDLSGNLTVNGFVGGVSGTDTAANITLRSDGTLTVGSGTIAATDRLELRSAQLSANANALFVADVLDVLAGGGIVLNTSASHLYLEASGPGNILVTEADAVDLERVLAVDGAINVTAGGTITAIDVRSLTDGAAKSITLKATGDIFVDYIEAAVNAGADKTAGVVNLDATGTIREPNGRIDNDTIDISAFTISFKHGNPLEDIPVVRFIGNAEVGLGTELEVYYIGGNLRNDLSSSDNGGLPTHVDGNYVLNAPNHTGHVSMTVTGNLKVVALGLSPGRFVKLTVGGTLTILPTLDVGASGKMILSAGTGITASGSLTAGSLRLTGAGISVVGSVTANSLTVTSTAGIAVGGSMTANAILLSSAAGITATGGLTADTVTLAAGDHFALNTRANFLTLAQNGTARNASIVEHDGLSLLGASLNGGNLSIVTGGGLDVDGAISGARDATLRANGGAIALNASVTATRNVNLTATGNVSSAAVVTADALIVRSGGAITLPTRVSILDLENSGPTGGILIDQVRAGGLVDVHRLAITHAGNGSHITLSTGNGNLGVAGGGAGVFTRGSGNVTLTANGTGADVVIGASVSATTGAISLQAVDQVTQGANITTSGGSITVAAGGPIEMADGTTALVSGAGSITYTAQGSVSLGVLDTQGHIDVTATGGSIVDNTGGEGANIRAGSATLTAANHIGAAGAADVDTRVTDLRLHSTVAGDIHIGEKNALNLIRAQTTASDIDLTTGGALAIGDIISPHNVRITAGGPVSNSGKVQAIDLTVVAVGAIQLNTEVTTLSAENTGATGAITITELNGGGAIRVQLLKQSQVSNSDQIQLHTQSGAIRVVASGQGVHHLGSGSIDLSAAGNVNIGQVISSQAGAITITAQTAITQNANITTQGGAINLTANDGRISQDRGTQASVTGSGTITLTATGDVRLNRVVTSGHADVTAGSGPSTGSIVDVSDEIESANLEASTAILLADVGIGGLGDDDLDTALDYLEAEAGSGGIWVDNLGNLVVGEISAVEGLTTAGPIVVSTAGSLSIREDVTSAANIDLSATAGDVGVIDGSSVLAATNANLLASGSIAIDGSYVTATAGMADLDAQGGQLSLINASMVTAFSSITGNAGTDLTIDSGSGAVAGDDAVLTAGNDLHLTATSTVQAQDLIAILGDHGNSDPGIGSSIQLQGILDGQRVEVSGEKDADSILLQLVNLVGHTQIFGQAGDDLITIDHLVTLITAHDRPADGVTGAVQDTVDIDGGEGADDVVVNVTAGRTEYIVNVHDTGTIGADADVLTINGTQPLDANHGSGNDLWLLRERFVAYMTPQVSLAAGVPPGTLHPEMERINYDGTINGRLQINSLGGDDQFYVDDNSSPTTLNSGNGADRFQIGQLFESERSAAAGIAPEDVFATVEVTRGLLSNGISHATSIVSGAGSDEFVVYHNLAALDLNGGGGDDRFEFRTFALAGSDESSAVAYVDNGPVQVDADGSSDSLLVIGTEFGDDLIVAEDLIAGAGLAVSYAAVESLEIDSAEGDDDIFVLSIGLDVTTNLLGGLGSDDFSIAGDAGTVDGATSWLSAQSGSHTTDVIRGVLTIDGFGGVGSVGRLVTAVTLPDETNLNPVPRDLHTNFSADETAALDTVTVYNDGSSTADVGTLAAASLLGLGMTPAGITYGNFEVVEVLLGTGNDDFRIDNTADGAITAVHGGGGDDLITANGRGGVDSRGYDAPLVIFGDTSQDGGRYDGIAGVPSPGDAWSFGNAGADTIDASASVQNVTIYGGIGEDVIDGGQAGDHLAGGSGNDTIHGHDGLDHLYGDSGVNVELATRVLTIPTVDDSSAPSRDPLGVGADTLSGDNGADLILGDHGVITQTTGTERILTTANVERIETVRPSDGGADRIFGGSDFDVILGGNGADFIKAGTDSAGAVVIGDSGSVTFGPLFPAVANVTTSDPTHGGADTITTGDGDDIVAGGYGADIIAIAGGSNTVLGDHGVVTFQEGTSILASVVSINLSTGGQTFLPTGSDTISTGLGNDVVIGGLGNDEITVAGGDNIILGDDGAITFQATSGLTDRIESRYLDGAGASPIDASEAVVGNDTISTGSGDDVVLAGLGDDVVTILDGANVVLGDEGFAQYQDQADTSGTAVLGTVSSQYLDGAMSFVQGGADSITTGDGDDTVIAGLGNDDITVADGANIVLGDGGSITYQLTSGLRDRIESRYLDDAGFAALDATEAVVGNDTISTGSGDDVVLAGLGDDVVTILDGANVVLGDEGFAQYQDQADTSGTAVLGTVSSQYLDGAGSFVQGGADSITTGAGDDTVIAGLGNDHVTLANGTNVVLGDEGSITYQLTSGLRDRIESRYLDDATVSAIDAAEAVVGNDTISMGSGDDVVIAGLGDDTVTVDAGSNVILGDEGLVQYQNQANTSGTGVLDTVSSQYLDGAGTFVQGGADTITTGAGGDTVLAGLGDDHVTIAYGDNIVLGDEGSITYQPTSGLRDRIQSRYLDASGVSPVAAVEAAVGNDTIATGAGHDVVIAGVGDDTVTIAAGSNVVLGDEGFVQYQDQADTSGATVLGEVSSQDLDGAGTFVQGGADTITTGVGNDTVIAGLGDDEVTIAYGGNIVLGDEGSISYQLRSGLRGSIESRYLDASGVSPVDATEAAVGNDTIATGAGNDVVVAGLGDDTVTIIDGANIVLGDEGIAQYQDQADTSGTAVLGEVSSQYLDGTGTFVQGGADTIRAGVGNDTVIAGLGDDQVTIINGNNIVLGDEGSITYQLTSGLRNRIESRYLDAAGLAALDAAEAVVGNDTIAAGAGNDLVIAGLGDDSVTSAAGSNVVFGDEGFAQYQDQADTYGAPVLGEVSSQYLDGAGTFVQGGADTITTGAGHDTVIAGLGDDDVTIAYGDNIVLGDEGSISYQLRSGLRASIQSRYLDASGVSPVDATEAVVGNDSIATGAGDDIVIASLGDDTVTVAGSDNLVLADEGLMVFELGTGLIASLQTLQSHQGGDDSVTTGSGGDILIGGFGEDNLTSGDGMSIILGDNGIVDYALDGDTADIDRVVTIDPSQGGDDVITSGDGADILIGGTGADVIFGGGGSDTILGDFARVTGDILLHRSFPTPNDPSFVYTSIDTNHSAAGDDTIDAGAGDDFVLGQQGGDIISGGAGQDDLTGGHNVLFGADDDDTIDGGDGADVILGDNGLITRHLLGDHTWARYPAPFADVIRDIVRFDHIDRVTGSDTLSGDGGDDIIWGQRGDDVLSGGAGDDELLGHLGDDTIYGDAGRDTLLGDEGRIVRDFDAAGLPRVNANGMWHRDIFLEQVGAITGVVDMDTTPFRDGSGAWIADGVLYVRGTVDNDEVKLKGRSRNGVELEANFIRTADNKIKFDRDETPFDAIVVDLLTGWNEYDIEYKYLDMTIDIVGVDGQMAGAYVSGGVLHVVGTEGSDDVEVKESGKGRIEIKADFIPAYGGKLTFDPEDLAFNSIVLDLGGGINTVDVDRKVDLPVTVNDVYDPARPFYADLILSPDMLLLTGAFNADGSKHLNADNGAWDTDALQIDVEAGGDDLLDGGADDDLLIGQLGDDVLIGGGGNDTLIGDNASNLLPYDTDQPQIVQGLRLIDAAPGVPIALAAGGSVVVTPMTIGPNDSGFWGPDIDVVSDVVPQFRAEATMDDLQRTDGTYLTSYVSVVTGILGHQEMIAGNDTLDGGEGADLVVGDHYEAFAVVLSGMSKLDDAYDDLINEFAALTHQLRSLMNEFDLMQHEIFGIEDGEHDIVIGADTVAGGEGDDTVVGDTLTYLGGFFDGIPDGAAPATNVDWQERALDYGSFLSDLDHVAVDFGFVTEFAKVQVLQVLVDDALAGDYASKVENDPDNHTLYLFNDTIAGDGGDDTIIGDDAIIAAAIADGVKFHDYGKNWVTGVDEYVRKAADYAVKDQAEVRRHELEAHVEVHHTNYDWSHEPSHSGIDKIPYSYGFDVIAGNDAIDGGDGDDLIIGDFGALVLPVVQTSPTTKKEVGELQRDVKYLIKDIEKVLDERYHLHREAAKHEHFFHRFGSHSHSHDDRYRDHSDIVLEIGNDVIQAGDGDDVVLGDNGLAGAVFAADTVGGPMDVDTHDWHLKHLIDEKASESLHRYDSHGWGDEFDEEIFGNDLIAGGAGDDLLYGQIGDDEMTGDAGDDYLRGGKGKNEVDGGAGKGKAEKGGSNLPQHDEQDEIDTMLLSTLNPVLSGALLDLSATDSRPTDSGTTDDGGDSTDDDSGTTDDDDDDDDDDKKKKKGKDKG